MKRKRIIIICITVLFLLIGIFLVNFERNDMDVNEALLSFSQLIENGKISSINLTIYHVNPRNFILFPYDVDFLVNNGADNIIYIKNLEAQIDLLKQIRSDTLIPVEEESRLNAEFYYIFKTKYGRKIFDVAMWGDDYSIYINGREFKSDDIFYDIIIPFLPEDIPEYLEACKDDANRVKDE